MNLLTMGSMRFSIWYEPVSNQIVSRQEVCKVEQLRSEGHNYEG